MTSSSARRRRDRRPLRLTLTDDHRRAAVAAVPVRARAQAGPAAARVAQRDAPAARDGARHPRLVARHRDHDRLVRRRRHVQLVDPPHGATNSSGPVDEIVSANGLRGAPALRVAAGEPAAIPNVDGTLAARRSTTRVASPPTTAPRARRAEGAAPRDRLRRGPPVRRRRARDRDLGPDARARARPSIGADLARDVAGRSRRRDRRVRLRRRPSGCGSSACSPSWASRASGAATRPRRTTCSSRPGTIAGMLGAERTAPRRCTAAVGRARLEPRRRRGRRAAAPTR